MNRTDQQALPPVWDIGLSAWVIQDGNYRDFEAGQTAEFAVEYWSKELAVDQRPRSPISAIHIGDCQYDTVAEIAFQNDRTTVLDIGIRCYGDALPAPASQGARIVIRVNLCVDAFSNFEAPDQTPLVYSWRIESILMQTAPWIDVPNSRRRVRDQARLGWKEIPRTDAWKDDNGDGEYILCCELLPISPKSTSATAL